MTRIKQLSNKDGESIYPLIGEEQIKHKANTTDIGDLNELTTEVKTSLVLAINENVASIEHNLQELGAKVTKEEVMEMIEGIGGGISKEELEELLLASAVIITINDSISDIKNTKANAEDIPTKLSELSNDKEFITKIQLAENTIIQKLQADIIDIYSKMGGFGTKEEIEQLKELIPLKTSLLENDSLFISAKDEEYIQIKKSVSTLLTQIQELATKESVSIVESKIPQKTSQIENDSGFVTLEDIPTGNLEEMKTDIQTLKETKAEKADVSREVKRLDDLIEAIEIPEGTDVRPIMKAIEELKSGKADKEDVPKLLSQLENDIKFITGEDLASSPEIQGLKSNVGQLEPRVTEVEKEVLAIELQANQNAEEVSTLKSETTQLQTDVGLLDTDVSLHTTQIKSMKDSHQKLSDKVEINTLQSQANKDAIESMELEIVGIPKQTSDLINDSGFLDRASVLAMDLKENPTISGLDKKKADKGDVPTKIEQLEGVETLQTKESATEEHKEIKGLIDTKSDKTDIPTKIGDLEDNIGVAKDEDLKKVQESVVANTTGIEKLNNVKHIIVTSSVIPVEDRQDGQLYLFVSTEENRLEDSLGNHVYVETNEIATLAGHPKEPRDGIIYVLESNRKGYITLNGKPELLALMGDVEAKDDILVGKITALQEDLGGANQNIKKNAEDIIKTNTKIPPIIKDIVQIKEDVTGNKSIIDGVSEDVLSLQQTVKGKANTEDIPTKTSTLENDSGFVTLADIPETDLEAVDSAIEELKTGKADKVHKHDNYAEKSTIPTKLTDLTDTTIDSPIRFAERVRIKDTRDVEETPLDIMSDRRPSLRFDFKRRTVVGSPDPDISAHRTYAHILTVYGWHDNTGGYPTQISFGKDKFGIRTGTSNETWSEWRKYSDDSIVVQKFTQKTEPVDMNVGDEWHKIRD